MSIGTNNRLNHMEDTSQKWLHLLFLLEKNRGSYLSGEFLAQSMGVSRNAIWKNINKLRKSGYDILAQNNKGYMLNPNTEILSEKGIYAQLEKLGARGEVSQPDRKKENHISHDVVNLTKRDWKIDVFESLPSTNLYLKEHIEKSVEHQVVIAKEQSAGIGRYGRSFFSPKDSGLYMSLKLSDKNSIEKREFLTVIAALCVCEAIDEISEQEPKIKWVNDILIDDRKICGILTQSWFDLESGNVDYFILGIGVNFFKPPQGFPQEISDTAGYLFEEKKPVLNQFVAILLRKLEHYLDRVDIETVAGRYRGKSMLIGRDVEVILAGKHVRAKVLDIDSMCRLVVQYENEEVEALNSAEVSIRF